MTTTIDLEHAREVARRAHEGQTRRHGAPYIDHPYAVATIVDDLGPAVGIDVQDADRATAILHDVVEDSDLDEAGVAAQFGDDVARRVSLLTKPPKDEAGARRDELYVARLDGGADDRLRLVKVCDRLHNLSELHLAPDRKKLDAYVEETLTHLVPLAGRARSPQVRVGLVAALMDGIRAACRAQSAPFPDAARLPSWKVPHGLYAILGAPSQLADGADVVDVIGRRFSAVVEGGAAIVQLRMKGASDRLVMEVLEAIVPVAKKRGVKLVVNDRADLCLASGADGVHVGRDDLPPPHVRALLGEDALIGTSTHSDDDVKAARQEGASDHLAFGPVYASSTKSGHADVVGVQKLAEVCARVPLPVVAIGGITSTQRMLEIARAGASLGAVVSALDVDDPRPIARRLALAHAAAFAARKHLSEEQAS